MNDDVRYLTDALDTVGTPDDEERDRDPTNGWWFESKVVGTLEHCGYTTARNEYCFELETDVIARRDERHHGPDDFVVAAHMDEMDVDHVLTYERHSDAFDVTTLPYRSHD